MYSNFYCCCSLFSTNYSHSFIYTVHANRDETASSQVQVIVGDHSLASNDGYEQVFDVAQIIMHPQYNIRNRMDHDVALLKLNGQIQYNDQVSPICLPRNDVADGYLCTVTGWGDTMGKAIIYRSTHQLMYCSCLLIFFIDF